MAQYSAALSSFTTIDATDDPTAEELARILVKVAKEDDFNTRNHRLDSSAAVKQRQPFSLELS